MIGDIFLGLSNIAIIIAFSFYVREHNKEKSKLINALIARNAQDLVNTTLADQTKVVTPKPQERRDIVATEELDDEEFAQMIAEQNKTDNVEFTT